MNLQVVENPLLPALNRDKLIANGLDFGLQKLYNATLQTTTAKNRISICMEEDSNPLRLNIDSNLLQHQEALAEQEDQVISIKPERELEEEYISQLYIVIGNQMEKTPTLDEADTGYFDFVCELPFATASFAALTPPPKFYTTEAPNTQTVYHEVEEEEEDEFQYTAANTTSPRMSMLLSVAEEDKEFTDQTWEAIFHPLSTFKHNQGDLEYYAWPTTDLPLAAARVAQRVIHATANDPQEEYLPVTPMDPVESEATVPVVMPTPPLKPSPVLTIVTESQEVEKDPISLQSEVYYYDMLKQIRGDHDIKTPATAQSKRSTFFFLNKKIEEVDEEALKIVVMSNQEPTARYWTEKRLFFLGFVCPLIWFYASVTMAKETSRWQKRCRLASVYFLLTVSVVGLVVSIKAAGIAGSRQAQSDSIRAVINQ